ncbi:MAG: endolytic transglycosylase MltG [Patescibacteria group bacterium]
MNDLDPTKYHIMSPVVKKRLVVLGIFFILVVLPALFYFYYSFAINRPSQNVKDFVFEINSGESATEIAQNLSDNNLVNSAAAFKLYMLLEGDASNLQAGVYNIPAGTSIVALANIFSIGKNDVQITFLEGWRLEEFALEAATKLNKVDYEEFITLARPYEGKLFPDTYFVNKEIDEEELVELLQETFKTKTAGVLTEEASRRLGYTPDQIVILASIVEREAFADEERPVIAGILFDRLKSGEILGVDATTQYVVATKEICPHFVTFKTDRCVPTMAEASSTNWWPQNITIFDLQDDNPYNTRTVVGLPPTPISNPGLSAINAVLNPEQTEYLYYLHDADGDIHYAATLDAHNANVARYLD